LTVVPLNVYKACPEKKETSQETKVQASTLEETKKPAPAVYEVGSEFIGELKWL
jgi:hypothetical protein